MNVNCKTTILLAISLSGSLALFKAPTVSAQTSRCDPIGRISSGSGKNFSEGSIICRGDRLEVEQGSPVQFLCFLSRTVVTLNSGVVIADEDLCSQSDASRRCGQDENRGLCFNPRGEIGEETFQIKQPTATAIAEDRPTIAWTPVENANRYSVRVLGTDVSWESSTQSTRLDYPSEELALEAGNAYRIVIIAQHDDRTLATTERILNIVSPTISRQERELSEGQ
jgi:hypothetical protein